MRSTARYFEKFSLCTRLRAPLGVAEGVSCVIYEFEARQDRVPSLVNCLANCFSCTRSRKMRTPGTKRTKWFIDCNYKLRMPARLMLPAMRVVFWKMYNRLKIQIETCHDADRLNKVAVTSKSKRASRIGRCPVGEFYRTAIKHVTKHNYIDCWHFPATPFSLARPRPLIHIFKMASEKR